MFEYLVGGVVGAAALTAALSALWRFFHLGEMRKGIADFLADWGGAPARPGVKAVPSFPERMAVVEERTFQLDRNGGQSLADAVHDTRRDIGTVSEAVEDIRAKAEANADALAAIDRRVIGLDERVSDHRRRNDKQIELLREEIRLRLDDAERNKALVAVLAELGHDMDIPKPKPHGGGK